MKDIKEYIRTVPDYPVPGVNFYDMNSLFAGPKFNDAIYELVQSSEKLYKTPTHIVGIESRGFVVGSAMANSFGLPLVMVRKKGAKYPGELLEETYTLEYGEATLTLQTGLLGHTDRCIVVDDLVATGGSVEATKTLIERTGAKVLGVSTIVDLVYARNGNNLSVPITALLREFE